MVGTRSFFSCCKELNDRLNESMNMEFTMQEEKDLIRVIIIVVGTRSFFSCIVNSIFILSFSRSILNYILKLTYLSLLSFIPLILVNIVKIGQHNVSHRGHQCDKNSMDGETDWNEMFNEDSPILR